MVIQGLKQNSSDNDIRIMKIVVVKGLYRDLWVQDLGTSSWTCAVAISYMHLLLGFGGGKTLLGTWALRVSFFIIETLQRECEKFE